MFLRNYWYVAAWGHEVGRQILARTICNEPMILYRAADGKVAAIEDRCCHRQMPLSKGWLEGDTVRCGYHGLRFDAAGKCVEIPGQPNIPPRARVRSTAATVSATSASSPTRRRCARRATTAARASTCIPIRRSRSGRTKWCRRSRSSTRR